MDNWSDASLHKAEMKRRFPIMRDLYKKHYTRKSTWVKVVIPADDRERLESFAIARLADKQARNDRGYTVDKHKAVQRGLLGVVGEEAVIIASRKHDVHLSMSTDIGPADQFNVPDFPEINLGCKAAKMGNIPVMYKNVEHDYPQVICLVDEQEDGSFIVYILGVAYPKILNDMRNRSDDGITDPRMLYKKTAFIGTRWLTPWEDYITRVKKSMAI
jgi:hypothetical protein